MFFTVNNQATNYERQDKQKDIYTMIPIEIALPVIS